MNRRSLLGVLIAAILIVAAIHVFFLMLVVIPGDGLEPSFLRGDRVVVNRWSYGLRSPFISFAGYSRYNPTPMRRNDWVAFNAPDTVPSLRPDTGRVCIGRCLALPGDTVWIGAQGKVSSYCDYSMGRIWPVIVPSRGQEVTIRPWNASLYAKTIRQHEGIDATVRSDSLCVEGKKVDKYCFQHDFYWMESGNDVNLLDSRAMGFIPEDNVIGRLRTVLYSLDGWRPRWSRAFKRVL